VKRNSEVLVSDEVWGWLPMEKGSNCSVVVTYVLHSSPFLWSPLHSSFFLFVIFVLVGSFI